MPTLTTTLRRQTFLAAAILTGTVLLAGCGSMPEFGGGDADAQADAATPADTVATGDVGRMMLTPGETVCLMPNAKIQSEQLDNVLLMGMQAGGVAARLTREGEPAGACPKTITYDLAVVEGKLKSMDFRLLEGTRPMAQASGPADEKGEIPLKRVHAYVATFVSRLLKTPVPAANPQAAEY